MSYRLCRLTVTALTVCSLVVPLACAPGDAGSDPGIPGLSVGIPRDSLLKIVAAGAPAGDSLPNVYRSEQYLHNGTIMEMLYYSRDGKKDGRDTVPEKTLTPIVLALGVVSGWGWPYFDSVAAAHDLRVRARP